MKDITMSIVVLTLIGSIAALLGEASMANAFKDIVITTSIPTQAQVILAITMTIFIFSLILLVTESFYSKEKKSEVS